MCLCAICVQMLVIKQCFNFVSLEGLFLKIVHDTFFDRL